MPLGAASQTVQTLDVAPPQGVLQLSASASVELPRDTLSVSFSATREGSDPAAVQSALKQALEAALVEARKIARPGQVEVQAGNLAVYPRYGKGAITGWQGSADMRVEGRDMTAIAQLAGRIQTMTLARVSYLLSRDAREKVEADVSSQAIARYRAKAAEMAKAFGYGGYSIREVSVTSNEPPPVMPMPRAAKMSVASEEALPIEPGTGTVSATVSGTVQMK
jgi:predicted secreted protein